MKNLIKKILPQRLFQSLQVLSGKRSLINTEDFYLLPKSQITYSHDLLYTYHNADFLKDPLFAESYRLGKATDDGTLLKDYDIEWRIHVLCWAANHAKNLEGDFADCGVGTGIFSRAVINFIDFQKTGKKYYLLDTFTGMDAKYSTDYEMQRNKKLRYNERNVYEQVQKTFANFNVEVIKGTVPDTLSKVTSEKICYLSVDMNSVVPEVAALEFFWPRMVSGGIIVLDDYGYPGCLEQKKAHDAFAKSKNVMILSLPTCQGMIIKP